MRIITGHPLDVNLVIKEIIESNFNQINMFIAIARWGLNMDQTIVSGNKRVSLPIHKCQEISCLKQKPIVINMPIK